MQRWTDHLVGSNDLATREYDTNDPMIQENAARKSVLMPTAYTRNAQAQRLIRR
jgi:hypothetical protein